MIYMKFLFLSIIYESRTIIQSIDFKIPFESINKFKHKKHQVYENNLNFHLTIVINIF